MLGAAEIAMLARLLELGGLKEGVRNQELVHRFATAGWIQPGTRKAIWNIRPEARAKIEGRLNFLLPTWISDFALLRKYSKDPFDPSNISALPMLRRNIRVDRAVVNRRNWNAAVGLGPKHAAKVSTTALLTSDWTVRFRPNQGLSGHIGSDLVDFWTLASIYTECVIPERAWLKFRSIGGRTPSIVITCENLGCYIDLPVGPSALVIFCPGSNVGPAVQLLKLLPEIPWIHFGDLDQDGLSIAEGMANVLGRQLRFFIPSFAGEYIDAARKVKTEWANVPPVEIFNTLKAARRRIFQEVFMLDERLGTDIARVLEELSSSGEWDVPS